MGCLGDCALFISFRNVTHMFGSIETMIPEDISCPRDIKVRSDVYDVHFDVSFIDKPVAQLFERIEQIGR